MDDLELAVARTWHPGPGDEMLYRVWNISITDTPDPVFCEGAWQDRAFRPPDVPKCPNRVEMAESLRTGRQTTLAQFEMGARR